MPFTIVLNLPFVESTEVLHKLADQYFATGDVQKAIKVSNRSSLLEYVTCPILVYTKGIARYLLYLNLKSFD